MHVEFQIPRFLAMSSLVSCLFNYIANIVAKIIFLSRNPTITTNILIRHMYVGHISISFISNLPPAMFYTTVHVKSCEALQIYF